MDITVIIIHKRTTVAVEIIAPAPIHVFPPGEGDSRTFRPTMAHIRTTTLDGKTHTRRVSVSNADDQVVYGSGSRRPLTDMPDWLIELVDSQAGPIPS